MQFSFIDSELKFKNYCGVCKGVSTFLQTAAKVACFYGRITNALLVLPQRQAGTEETTGPLKKANEHG
jgi:hypothetical protein